jgi:hypothetical protein
VIGAAYGRLDDVLNPFGSWPCIDAAYIAGELRAACDDEQVEVCRAEP